MRRPRSAYYLYTKRVGFQSEDPEQLGFPSDLSVLLDIICGISRFRCVAHYVKVVATPEGLGVIWTPSLFREVLTLLIHFTEA